MANERYKALWDLTHGQRARYAASLGALFAGIGLSLLVPLATRRAIDDVVLGEAPRWWLGAAAAVIVALSILSAMCMYAKGRWVAEASHGIARRVRMRLYDHLQHLPCPYFDSAESGDLVQRCTSDVETLRVFLSMQVVQIGRAVLMLAILVPLLAALDLRMTAASLGVIPFIIVYSTWFFGRVKRLYRCADESEGAMTSVLQENLTGIRVARAFGRERFEIARFAAKAAAFRDDSFAVSRLMARYWGVSDALCMTQVGAVLLTGGAWVIDGSLSVGTYFAFVSYINMLVWPIRQLGRILTDLGKAVVAMGRIEEILEVARESSDGRPLPAAKQPGRIVVRNLSFAHGDGTQTLSELSFAVEPGETLAIVGPSGSGKSTLMHLLVRLYDYREGTVLLDGRELRSIARSSVRRRVCAALQDPFLFSRTIGANVRFGREGASEGEMIEAAETACIHDSIQGFEEGYQTMVGERGVTLSGGQRQRVALSRALLADPDVLILDDALSAVDAKTEERIRTALTERRGRRTTLIIAHRLSTLAHADRILVLSHGRVCQLGTHDQLVADPGPYSRLWGLQTTLEDELARSPTPGRSNGR